MAHPLFSNQEIFEDRWGLKLSSENELNWICTKNGIANNETHYRQFTSLRIQENPAKSQLPKAKS